MREMAPIHPPARRCLTHLRGGVATHASIAAEAKAGTALGWRLSLVPRFFASFDFGDLRSNLAELCHDHSNISEVGGIARVLEVSDPFRKQPEEHDSAFQQLDSALQ